MATAVFLDRDGTLNFDSGYVSSLENFKILPGVYKSLGLLKAAGFLLIVISNQSGLGRGLITESQLTSLHSYLNQKFAAAGCSLDGIFFCPHSPEDQCCCRKPRPGLIDQALERFPNIDPKESYFIGDKPSDIDCGASRGMKTIQLLGSPTEKEVLGATTQPVHPNACFYTRDLVAAATLITGLLLA